MNAGGLLLGKSTIKAMPNSVELKLESYQHDQLTDQY